MPRFAVILPAAGQSTRFGSSVEKKIFQELEGRPIWLRAVEPFLNRADVGQILIAIAAEDREKFLSRYSANIAFLGLTVIEGGAERFETVAKAVALADPTCDFIAVHDAARPCLASAWVDSVFLEATRVGAALLAIPVVDTLKQVDPETQEVRGTVPRAGLYQAQTPQVFRRDWLIEAHARRSAEGWDVTDDVQLLEKMGRPCVVVAGSPLNLKVTTVDDLAIARAALAALPQPSRRISGSPFSAEESMWIGDFPEPPAGRV